MKDLMGKLNEEQLKAVLDTEGAVMVTAGAGSGKTRLLTHRIAHLITDNNVDSYNILAITFTNKAASEMKERLLNMIPDISNLWVSTFHSMCVKILRQFGSKADFTSNFSIYGEDEKDKTLKIILKAKELEPDEYLKKITWAMSNAKNQGITPDEYMAQHKYEDDIETICDVFSLYQKELKNNNALDYDDLLVKAYELLACYEDVREHYQRRFHYIHVDEFQDTNLIQYKLVKILAEMHKNIMVVGDEDQSIYGWRGANIENIFNFRKDFNCKSYKLEQNYRSSKKILNLANKLIAFNSSRIEKNLWTENDEGVPVEYIMAVSEGNEADNVVYRIQKYVKEMGYNYSDIAILMRLNALSRSFEERLIQYGIPHKIFGGFKFFERKEIKDILAYLKIIGNPLDTEAITRVINFPKRGIGDGTISQLKSYAQIQEEPLSDVIKKIKNNPDLPISVVKKVIPFSELINELCAYKQTATLTDMVTHLVKMLRIDEVFGENTEENINRKRNIDEFCSSVKQFAENNEIATLEDYLQMITLYTDLDEMDEKQDCVNIATVHSAKGLEFKVVFIIGLEEGVFPISRATDSTDDLEEERRLLYVAITRAKERLHLSKAATRFLYGQRKPTMPSRFLKDIDIDQSSVSAERTEGFGASSFASSTNGNYSSRGSFGNQSYRSYKVAPQSTVPKIPMVPTSVPTAQKNIGLDVQKLKVGSKLNHKKFGEGVIIKLSNEHNNYYAEIEFAKVGKITLAIDYAPLTIIED